MVQNNNPIKIIPEIAYWIDKKGTIDITATIEDFKAFYGTQGMLSTDKAIYKTLARQCGEAHRCLYDQGISMGRIKSKSPTTFNNRLDRMQKFIKSIPYGDFTNNRWLRLKHVI